MMNKVVQKTNQSSFLMVKNKTIIGVCEDYSSQGFGVVKQDSFVIFVKGMLKGEEGEILITLVKKNYAYGKLVKLYKESLNRVSPLCSSAKSCGGCQLQHINYQEQLSFKQAVVKQTLARVAGYEGLIENIIYADDPYRYRNKVLVPLAIDKNNMAYGGFYRFNTHEVIKFSDCLLQSVNCNEVFHYLISLINQFNYQHNIRSILIRESLSKSELMIVLVTKTFDLKDLKFFINNLTSKFPLIVSVMLNLKNSDDNVVLGEELLNVFGDEYLTDHFMNLDFQISARAFYQINTRQCEKLYSKAYEFANLNKEMRVLDLYCGIGTIGLIIANRVKEVVGVEVILEAIEDAKVNARINKIKNASFIVGDAGLIASDLDKKFDLVFVDPPRKGLDDKTKQALIKIASEKIVYVSCDIGTLSRDIKDLSEHYKVEKVAVVDMFPNTTHVETVVLMSKADK